MADDAPTDDPFEPRKTDGMGRRQFVKTAVGAAAFGAVGAAGAGLVVPLSTAGRLKVKRFPYWGAKKVDGPAPQGIPLIPVKVNKEGFVEGVTTLEGAPLPQSLEWYRYCAHEAAPGLQEGFTDDNVMRYFTNPDKVKRAAGDLGHALWYADKLDQRIKASDFTEPGMGAPFRWRSEGQEGTNIITGILIKMQPGEVRGKDISKFMDEDLVAYCSFCAHFCCVPGYQESKIPLGKGIVDKIYCTCHDTVYDPHQIKEYTFPPNL